MAVYMIPEEPKDFDDASHEDIVFNALKYNYRGSEDYYVFHSYNAVSYSQKDNTLYERELDFVIANAKKGILCIEVKAGDSIYYGSDREWHYSSGRVMEHNGPYKQIAGAKRTLSGKVQYHRNSSVQSLFNKCRFIGAVCFVDFMEKDFLKLEGLPEEATREMTILQDDIEHIWDKIEKIYSIKLPKERYSTELSNGMNNAEFKLLLDSVLCPEFHLIPSSESVPGIINFRLKQLIREQFVLLEFLKDQPSAVISGAAGTGKTMIAMEKARQHSIDGDKVLFLCYNKKLQKHLEEESLRNPDYSNVSIMTISKLTNDKTGRMNNYEGLVRWLSQCITREKEFGYKHVIIDEGQDFGVIDVDNHPEAIGEGKVNCDIINKLQEAVLEQGGTFYLFYDKYQMIQGGKQVENILPDCITDAECHLTLQKNCRNTKEIAKTSVTPIKDKKGRALNVETAYSWMIPYTPKMYVINDKTEEIDILNKIIEDNLQLGLQDMVILSQGALEYSSLNGLLIESTATNPYDYYLYNGKKIKVATCITFKGLEADAVILLNLNNKSFAGEQGNEFYVGSSRAKCKLDMICTLNDSDYRDIIAGIDEGAVSGNNNSRALKRIFSNLFSVEVVTE